MADIRINALATTAASTASDDFVAVDGSANGTRKLNAYSPTFGGNVVATGTLTVNSTTDSSSKDTGAIVTEGGLGVEKSATIGGNLTVSGTDGITLSDSGSTAVLRLAGGGNELLQLYGSNAAVTTVQIGPNGATTALQLTSTTATLAGNLTVSGTGTSSVAGKLQLGATTATGFNTLLESSGITTGRGVYQITSTGAWLIAGIEASAGGTTLTGSTAYASYLGSFTNTPLHLVSNSTISATLFANGNLFVGASPVDGGQKLQVSGNIGIGTNQWHFSLQDAKERLFYASNSTTVYRGWGSGVNHEFRTSGDAMILQLDNSQNATFGGKITTSAPTGGAGAWELGVANTVSPTSPNRTITIEIGGTVYYLHAKTTND